jgi:hypothetical protein
VSEPVAQSASTKLAELERLDWQELEALLLGGTTPKSEDLAGWEFRGVNTPGWTRWVGIKKFCKGFYRRAGALYGYNVPVAQNSLDQPWLLRPSEERPKRFGFYRVTEVDASGRDNRYLHALLLDYSRGGESRYQPERGLRDYLVQLSWRCDVSTHLCDLYLGKAYYAIGPLRVAASFFILERWRQALTEVRDA